LQCTKFHELLINHVGEFAMNDKVHTELSQIFDPVTLTFDL
jgi:hypothetical protein